MLALAVLVIPVAVATGPLLRVLRRMLGGVLVMESCTLTLALPWG